MRQPTIIHGDAQHLPLADCSVDAVVCDPPYELGFMGKRWDSTGVAYDVATWREALRVLKPGGFLLAFGGSRTWHRLACAIEDAGFELRDSLAWMYGSGFPKSLDVSKAIDKRRDDRADILAVTAYVRNARDAAGLRNAEVDAALGVTAMCDHWCRRAPLQAAVPTWEQWSQLRDLLGFGTEMDAEVWRLNGRKGTPGEAWDQREIIGRWESPGRGKRSAEQAYGLTNDAGDITTPATDDARRWQGFGTALKPAWEPIVVARKPLAAGTVAANVLQWGCGALNVDGCRVPGDVPQVIQGGRRSVGGIMNAIGDERGTLSRPHAAGRWPTNVVLSHAGLTDGAGDIIGDACADGCVDGCPVAELDAQSGTSRSQPQGRRQREMTSRGYEGGGLGQRKCADHEFVDGLESRGYGDTGGASRFFSVFRHSAHDQVFFPIESVTWEQPGDGSTRDASTSAGRSTASSTENSPTDGSGSRPTETSPTATRSTTGTTTRSTTTSTTSCVLPPNGTTTITSGSASNTDGSTESRNDDASGATNGSRLQSSASDAQGPSTVTAKSAPRRTAASGLAQDGMSSTLDGENGTPEDFPRSFPVFRYQAKAPVRERPKVNGVSHPTVKPLGLMRWLVRLVTPPGGTVLDMFAGSGATIEAALLEGFNAIGVERSAEYLPLIRHRIDRATTATAQPAVDDVAEPTLFDVA